MRGDGEADAGARADLVGRDGEIAVLGSRLDDASSGRACSLVVTGDAGVGKSALAAHLIRRATGAGFTVLHATGSEIEADLGFGALHALLAPVLADGGAGAQVPALRGALGLADQPTTALATNQAVLSLLSRLTERSPVLVLVDDAHWVDAASLRALLFVTHRIVAERMLVVFCQRPGTRSLLDRTALDRLDVGGLDKDAGVGLLSRHGVAADVARDCWERIGGNPLALIEAAGGLDDHQRQGRSPLPADLPVSDRLLQFYGAQLARLAPATHRALGVLALEPSGGGSIVAGALARLGRSLADLEPAERLGTVVLHGDSWSWRHPLLPTALRRLLPPGELRRIHRAIAGDEAGLHPDRIAWHLAESTVGPDEAVADRLEEIGRRCLRRGAAAAAADAFARASRHSGDRASSIRRLLLAAQAHVDGGDMGDVIELLTPVIDDVDDVVLAADIASVLAQAEMWNTGSVMAAHRCEAHAATVAYRSPDRAATLLGYAAVARLLALDTERATELAGRAVRVSAAHTDPVRQMASDALWELVSTLDGGRTIEPELLGAIGELALRAVEAGDAGGTVFAQLCAFVLLVGERLDEVVDLTTRVIAVSRADGTVGRGVLARMFRGDALWRSGRWDEALAEVTQALALERATGFGENSLLTGQLARLEACGEREDSCREYAAAALAATERMREPHPAVLGRGALGLLALGAERYEEAAEQYDELCSLAGRLRHPGWWWWHADAIEAFHGAGRRADAARLLDRLTEDGTRTGGRWAAGAVARCRAMAGGDGEPGALARCDEAVDAFSAIPAPFETARTLLLRAHLQGRRPDGRGAGPAARDLTEARRIFDRLGAPAWSRRCAQAPGAAAGDAQAAGAPLANLLTSAEMRVALVVGAGVTNRQAADQLYLSVKTVDFHLQSIYRKLGLRRRAQLAALVAAHRG